MQIASAKSRSASGECPVYYMHPVYLVDELVLAL